MPDDRLEVAVRKTELGIVIEATGTIDLITVGTFDSPLAQGVVETIKATAAPLTVDLSRLHFIDNAGLSLLVEARKKLASAGCVLQVFATRDAQPDRVLRAGHFNTIMTILYADEGDASE